MSITETLLIDILSDAAMSGVPEDVTASRVHDLLMADSLCGDH